MNHGFTTEFDACQTTAQPSWTHESRVSHSHAPSACDLVTRNSTNGLLQLLRCSQGAVDFFTAALSRIYAACGQLPEEASSGFTRCDVNILAKVARNMLKNGVDRSCEAVLSFSERLTQVADDRTQLVWTPQCHMTFLAHASMHLEYAMVVEMHHGHELLLH
jgi:hypothetical protein